MLTAVLMRSAVRRTVGVLALALPASAWMVVAGAAPPASACTTSVHCYAEAVNSNTNANHGVGADLYVHCLYQPNDGNRLQNEIWDANRTNPITAWVEDGITSGLAHKGYVDKDWFWGYKIPGENVVENDTSVTAKTDTSYGARIAFASTDKWFVYGDNSFAYMGTAPESATLNYPLGGTEYTGNETSGIRDQGDIAHLQREGTDGTWYNWGKAGSNANLGPGFYIYGTYDKSTSYEIWAGPC